MDVAEPRALRDPRAVAYSLAMQSTPPPKKKKLPWWAGLLIIFGVLVLIGLAAVGGFVWWIAANKDRLLAEGKESIEEAQRYAASHEQKECVDEGLARANRCGGLMCETNASVFTTACIREAEISPGFCDEVPERTEIIAMSRWAIAECKRRGKGNVQRCQRLMQGVAEACHQPQVQ